MVRARIPKSLSNIDLNLLVLFEAIYSTSNLSRAAEQLSMTQSAASHALARLRELTGNALFLRSGYGVTPTQKAKSMIGPVRNALGMISAEMGIGSDFDLASYTRIFKIMIVEPLEAVMMPPLLQQIYRQAPGVVVESLIPRGTFIEDLTSGALDIACNVYQATHSEIVTEPLAPMEMVLVARRGHPLIGGGKLNAHTFAKLGHLGFVPELRSALNIDRDLMANRLSRRFIYLCTRSSSFVPLVASTDLVAFMARYNAREAAEHYGLEIHEPPVSITPQPLFMMWHLRNQNDPGHKWLRETMLQAMRDATARASPSSRTSGRRAAGVKKQREPVRRSRSGSGR